MSEPAIRLVWKKIDKLIPYEHNAKLHPQEQLDKLVNSFDEFGRIVPAGIDNEGRLIYGHGRILAARQRGDTDFPCIEIEGLSDNQRRAFVHADNLLSQSGTDEAVLRAEMIELSAAGFDISLTGYDPEGLKLGTESQLKTISEDDFDEKPPEEPVAQRGQIWQLGEHRLMCGDATRPEDMKKLVDGPPADMVFTDPPYGVAIGDKNKAIDEIAGGKSGWCKENIVGDTLAAEQLAPILKTAFTNMRETCSDEASYYVTSPPGGDLGLMMMMMSEAGLRVRHVLCWVKNAPTFSIGRLDYDYKHEAILYTWTKTHHFYGDYSSTVVDDTKPIDKMKPAELKELVRALQQRQPEDVVYCEKPTASRLHPTMKPIRLIARFVINSSRQGDVVLDPFGGSGSTLIACEQLGRRCRMMEIDPHYCDVIIRRWETFTGKKAVLLDG